jgi:hypothetical protein
MEQAKEDHRKSKEKVEHIKQIIDQYKQKIKEEEKNLNKAISESIGKYGIWCRSVASNHEDFPLYFIYQQYLTPPKDYPSLIQIYETTSPYLEKGYVVFAQSHGDKMKFIDEQAASYSDIITADHNYSWCLMKIDENGLHYCSEYKKDIMDW